MRVGDYVQLRRRTPPFLRRGSRGYIKEIDGQWVGIKQYHSNRIHYVHQDNVTVIDRGNGGIVWQSTQS